jgi:hypothetical protein
MTWLHILYNFNLIVYLTRASQHIMSRCYRDYVIYHVQNKSQILKYYEQILCLCYISCTDMYVLVTYHAQMFITLLYLMYRFYALQIMYRFYVFATYHVQIFMSLLHIMYRFYILLLIIYKFYAFITCHVQILCHCYTSCTYFMHLLHIITDMMPFLHIMYK